MGSVKSNINENVQIIGYLSEILDGHNERYVCAMHDRAFINVVKAAMQAALCDLMAAAIQ